MIDIPSILRTFNLLSFSIAFIFLYITAINANASVDKTDEQISILDDGTDFRMKRSYICPKCDRQKQLLLNPRQRTIKIGAIEDIGIGAKINKTGNIGSNKFLRFENFINHLSKNKNKNDSYEIGAINNILTGSKVNKTGIIGNNTMVVHGNTGNSSSGRIKGNFRFGTMKNIATNSNITNMGKVVGGKIIQVPSKK